MPKFLESVGRAIGGAVKDVGEGIAHGVQKAAEWTGHLLGIDGGRGRVANIDDEVEAILAGNSGPWHSGARTANKVAEQHAGLSKQVRDMAITLESAWTGNAAQAAGSRIQRLETVLDSAGVTFNTNADNVTSVASYFDYTQQHVKKLPKPAPEAGFLDRLKPWDTDTEQAIADYNAQAKQNAQVYKAYANHTTSSRGSLQGSYGDLGTFDSGDITIVKDPVASPPPPGGKKPGPGRKQSEPYTAVTPPPSTATPPPPGTVAPSSHNTDMGMGARPRGGGDDTTAAGYVPPETFPGGPPSTGAQPPGIAPGTGLGPGGTAPYVGMGGPGSGPGAKTPGGPGGLPGAGRHTGAGVPGENGTRGGVGNTGKTAGSRLQNLPGGMAPGGRGAKEEDTEHQRKYILDTDTLFTDDDRKDLDPTTGLPVVPPTIGA